MPVAAWGIPCDVYGLYVKGICSTCVAGTDKRAHQNMSADYRQGRISAKVH